MSLPNYVSLNLKPYTSLTFNKDFVAVDPTKDNLTSNNSFFLVEDDLLDLYPNQKGQGLKLSSGLYLKKNTKITAYSQPPSSGHPIQGYGNMTALFSSDVDVSLIGKETLDGTVIRAGAVDKNGVLHDDFTSSDSDLLAYLYSNKTHSSSHYYPGMVNNTAFRHTKGEDFVVYLRDDSFSGTTVMDFYFYPSDYSDKVFELGSGTKDVFLPEQIDENSTGNDLIAYNSGFRSKVTLPTSDVSSDYLVIEFFSSNIHITSSKRVGISLDDA